MEDGSARGRPRQAETDARLLRAALELLREKGPAAVSIEAVSSRSGVARTTIYRRFANRRQLIAAAIAEVLDRPLPPGDLSLEAKVRWELEEVRKLFETGLGKGALGAILDDADPEFTEPLREALERRLTPLRRQVQSDIDSGLVARQVSADAVAGALLGAYLAEVMRHGEPRPAWTEGTVQLLVRALEVRGRAT